MGAPGCDTALVECYLSLSSNAEVVSSRTRLFVHPGSRRMHLALPLDETLVGMFDGGTVYEDEATLASEEESLQPLGPPPRSPNYMANLHNKSYTSWKP